MYYIEAWICGKLCWKGSPSGKWIPFTISKYKDRVLDLEKQIAELKNKITIESLPSFLYEDRGQVIIGEHGDTVVTDEWIKWKKQNLK